MDFLKKSKTLVSVIVGMILSIAFTVENLDADKKGADDLTAQALKSVAEVLQALANESEAKLIVALEALVTVATGWLGFLREKEASEKTAKA